MPGRIFFGRKASPPSSSSSSIASTDTPVITGLKRVSQVHRGSFNLESALSSMDIKKSHKHAKNSAVPEPAVKMDMEIESPPLVLYGPAHSSTGALLSGQLKLVVTVPEIEIDTFTMQFLANTTTKKPVAPHCPQCSLQATELHKWTFHTESHKLAKGVHSYPFSFLLPGNLPATCFGKLGHIDYVLSAVATSSPSSPQPITLKRPIKIQRAIMPLPEEKTSVRIFPPTKLTTSVTFQPILHPIGDVPVFLRLDGVTHRDKGMQMRWRLRKMHWRLEEHSKIVSPACAKHAAKVGGEGKGLLHQDTRAIGDAEIKSGWKTDFSGNGQVEIEFKVGAKVDRDPICDVESPNGLAVTHHLIIELIVAEEYCYDRTPNAITPTGSARVLRMQFAVVVTDRAGLGISWDEEQPPMYADVPASPPIYTSWENYGGPPLDDPDTFNLN